MQLTDILAQTGGLKAMASELGVSESEAATGAAALLPAILGGFQKRTPSPADSLSGLGSLVAGLGGGGLLDQVLAPGPTDVSRGNDVLGEIFGTKDVSRTVATHAASRSGLDSALLKRMLPMLAMLVTGYLAKHQHAAPAAGAGGGLGGLLAGLLAGARGSRGAAGGLASMLDADGNGNPLDDILRMAGRG